MGGGGSSWLVSPPSTHLEDLEEPPVPGLPPPLEVVQGAEGSGENPQGSLPGRDEGPVLLACEGPLWLSGTGGSPAPQIPLPSLSSTGLRSPAQPQGDPPAPLAAAAPWVRSRTQQPGGPRDPRGQSGAGPEPTGNDVP